jgi:hypothetical protein
VGQGSGDYRRVRGTDGFDAVRDSGAFPVSPDYGGYRQAHDSGGLPARNSGAFPAPRDSGSFPVPRDSGAFPAAPGQGGYPPRRDPGGYSGGRHPAGSPGPRDPGQPPGPRHSSGFRGPRDPGGSPGPRSPGGQPSARYPAELPAAPDPGGYLGTPQLGQHPYPEAYPDVRASGGFPGVRDSGYTRPPQAPGGPGARNSGAFPGVRDPGGFTDPRNSGSFPAAPRDSGGYPAVPRYSGGFPAARYSGGYPAAPNSGGFPAAPRDSGGYPAARDSGGFPAAPRDSGGFPAGRNSGSFAAPRHSGGFPTARDSGGFAVPRDPGVPPWDAGPRQATGPQPLTLRFTPTISTGAPMGPVAPPADFLTSRPRRAERLAASGPMPASAGLGGVVPGRVVSGPMPSAGQLPTDSGPRGRFRASGGHDTLDGRDTPDGLDGENAGLRRLRIPPFRPDRPRPGTAFGQEILHTMRSRNLVTGLAIPIMVAIAVGVAVVVAAGANNGSGGLAPSQLSAGFPPARIATADFAGSAAQAGRGTRVTLGAVAAFGSQVVAVGAQSGGSIGRALFLHSGNNGNAWKLGTVHGAGAIAPPPQATPRLVTGGPAGWVAIGTGFTFTSSDGQSWLVGPGLPQQPGDQVTAVTAAGTGFIATGQTAVGNSTAPVLWLSVTGTVWRRLAGPRLSLPVAAGTRVTGITHGAASGTVIVLAGTVTTAGGARASAAWRSADGGATWTPAMIPAAANNGGGAIAGLAQLGNGFVAVRPAVVNGTAGANVYTSADGAAWRQSATIKTTDGAPLAIGQVTGGPGGAVVEGSARGFLFAFLSTNGATWLGTNTFGASASQRVSGAALTAAGQAAVAVSNGTGGGLTAQYPVMTLIGPKGGPIQASLAGIAGVRQAEVSVNAIAASGATQVAGGSADGFPVLWSSPDGGSTWARGAGATAATFSRAGDQQVTGVATGRAGWVAVGGAAALAPGHPLVVGSADGGRHWTAEDGGTGFAGNDLVTSSVAAGRAGGYAIVGWQANGAHSTGMAWYSAGLAGWRPAVVSLTGGDSQFMAVTAMARGFVAAGSSGARPAAWVSPNGMVWRQVTLALPASATRAVLQYVAANGTTVVAAGTALAASGARFPFAAISTDSGATWEQSPLPAPSPAGTLAISGLTAAGSGFTAIGTFGLPGNQDVVIWNHGPGNGGAWMAVAPAGNGLSGPGIEEITALASTGSTLTGAGFTATPTGTVPTLWQSPLRG